MNTYLTTEQRTELIENYLSHWSDIIDTWSWEDEARDQQLSEHELRSALNSLSHSRLQKTIETDEFPDTVIMIHRMNNE